MDKGLKFKSSVHFLELIEEEKHILRQIQEEIVDKSDINGISERVLSHFLESLEKRGLILISNISSKTKIKITNNGWEALHEDILEGLDKCVLKNLISEVRSESPIPDFSPNLHQKHYASMAIRGLAKHSNPDEKLGSEDSDYIDEITVKGWEMIRNDYKSPISLFYAYPELYCE